MSAQLGEFLSNTDDPALPATRDHFEPSYHAFLNGPTAVESEWQSHLAWLAENAIGRPKATASHTVAELEAQGVVGVYRRP